MDLSFEVILLGSQYVCLLVFTSAGIFVRRDVRVEGIVSCDECF